jgi:hypothetical protein
MPRMKNRSLAMGLMLLLAPCTCSAIGLELAAYVGRAIPKYDQTFTYDPGLLGVRIPGVTLRESGTFSLEASGGLTVSGAATVYLLDFVGIEGRIDSAEAKADITNSHYDVVADLPFPFSQLTGRADFTGGTAQLERLKPLSLNVKLRTPGPIRFTFSGGVSFLNELNATAHQTIALGVAGVTPVSIDVARVGVSFKAQAVPTESGSNGKLGGNAGAGLQFKVGSHFAVVGEARGFLFKKRKLQWTATPDQSLPPAQAIVFQSILNRLEPVEFNPTYWQATGGIAISF